MKQMGAMNVLNDKMKQVAYIIGKHMIMILPDKYQKMLFDTIPMMEIVLQILVECCEDAYNFQWSNKKIRYAKNVYKAMTYTYQTSEK